MRWSQQQLDEYLAKKSNPDIDELLKYQDIADPGKESNLQIKIEKWAKERGYPCLSIRQIVTKYPQIAHLFKNHPDIIIALPKNRTVRLELKSKSGEARKGQKQMALQLMQLGHEWYQIRSFKRFLEVVGNEPL